MDKISTLTTLLVPIPWACSLKYGLRCTELVQSEINEILLGTVWKQFLSANGLKGMKINCKKL